MKYVVLVPDGCADEPLDELGGRTPLEAARMPRLAALAARAEVGRAAVIPPGLPPGSDVGNMAILGYDPAEYHTGRAPIEAAAMGVELAPDEVAYRCNLVTVDDAGTMVDFAAGHPTDEQSHPIVAALDAALGEGRDGVRFHAGVEYRHLCVAPATGATPNASRPTTSPAARRCSRPVRRPRSSIALMDGVAAGRARAAARPSGCAATQIWLWGQGVRPTLPAFSEQHGVAGRLSSAVDLVRGLGVLTGLDVVDVPGATAGFDNDYVAQRDACLASLAGSRPSSCCTSRRPTRPAMPAMSPRRSLLSSAGTPTSSGRSPTPSTVSRGAFSSCPTTRRRARCERTRATPCRTSCSTSLSTRLAAPTRRRASPGLLSVPAHELMGRLLA